MKVDNKIYQVIITTFLLVLNANCGTHKWLDGFWIERKLKLEKETTHSTTKHVNTKLYMFKNDGSLIFYKGYIGRAYEPDTLHLELNEGGVVFKGIYELRNKKIFLKYSIFKGIKSRPKAKIKENILYDTLNIDNLEKMVIPIDAIGYKAVFGEKENGEDKNE